MVLSPEEGGEEEAGGDAEAKLYRPMTEAIDPQAQDEEKPDDSDHAPIRGGAAQPEGEAQRGQER